MIQHNAWVSFACMPSENYVIVASDDKHDYSQICEEICYESTFEQYIYHNYLFHLKQKI